MMDSAHVAADLAVLFADDGHSEPAEYLPGGEAPAVPVQALFGRVEINVIKDDVVGDFTTCSIREEQFATAPESRRAIKRNPSAPAPEVWQIQTISQAGGVYQFALTKNIRPCRR